jgi:hypothetical protein
VFGLMVFAMELFAFWPMARRLVRRRSVALHLALTALLALTAAGLLLTRGL